MASTWNWGSVTQATPLRVKLDGDSAALTITPDSLEDPRFFAVGDRVRCELADRRVIVVGRSNGAGAGAIVPVGSVLPFAGSAAPSGYLLANGALISRTTYAVLFAAVGTVYGVGDGTTTFALPNLLGRVPVGRDVAQTEFDVLGEVGGAKTHTLTVAQLPAHTHQQRYPTATTGGDMDTGNVNTGGGSRFATATSNSTGSDTAHNNLQPYIALNYIIKS